MASQTYGFLDVSRLYPRNIGPGSTTIPLWQLGQTELQTQTQTAPQTQPATQTQTAPQTQPATQTQPAPRSIDSSNTVLGVDDVYIGLTKLTIPPERIKVTTVSDADIIPSLRSTTSTLVKSGRSRIRIDLSAIIPDLKTANTVLREIAAQFRMSPILIIRSDYIRRMVQPTELSQVHLADAIGELDKIQSSLIVKFTEYDTNLKYSLDAIQIHDAHAESELVKAKENLVELVGLIRTYFHQRATTSNDNQTFQDLHSKVTNSLGLLVREGVLDAGAVGNLYLMINTLSELNVIRSHKNGSPQTDATQPSPENNAATVRNITGPYVPVVLNYMSVQNMEGHPEAFILELSMMYFNHQPYARFLEFKDQDGNGTDNIDKCPWFKTYIDSQLTDVGDVLHESNTRIFREIYHREFGRVGFRFPTTKLQQTSATGKTTVKELTVAHNLPTEALVPTITESDVTYTNQFFDLLIEKKDPVVSLVSVMVSIGNRVAFQPILDSVYPTAQYAGGMNATISLVFSIAGDSKADHDAALARFLSMKRSVEEVCVAFGSRTRRNSRIFISESLVNLLGINACNINDMVVETVGPKHSILRMSLVEYSSYRDTREILKNTKGSVSGMLRKLLEWAVPIVSETCATARLFANSLSLDAFIGDMLGIKMAHTNNDLSNAQKLIGHNSFWLIGLLYRDGIDDYIAKKLDLNRRDDTSKLMELLTEVRALANNVTPFDWITPRLRSLRSKALELNSQTLVDSIDQILEARSSPENRAAKLDSIASLLSYQISLLQIRDNNFSYRKNPIQYSPDLLGNIRAQIDTASYTHPTALPESIVQIALKRIPQNESAKDNLATYASLGVSGTESSAVPRISERGSLYKAPPTPSLSLINKIVEVVSDIENTGSAYVPKEEKFYPKNNELQTIYNAVLMVMNRFPEFAKIIEQEDSTNRMSLYPDLNLPTYGTLYKDVIKRLSEQSNPITETTDLDSLPPEKKNVLLRFIPTYADLGITPPKGKSRESFARSLDDEVEPGFFWFTTKTPNNNIGNPANVGPTTSNKVSEYLPAIKQVLQNSGSVDLGSIEQNYMILDHLEKATRTNAFSMSRVYPTFKLFFVEPQDQHISVVDDLYGYNSVLSIKLHRHKFFPETLEIDISNTHGVFDERPDNIRVVSDLSIQSSESGAGTIRGQDAYSRVVEQLRREVAQYARPDLRNPVTGKKAFLNDLFIREGTQVILKMGYTNKASELETVFAGKVAELRRGDVMKLICQGYASELTVPVNIGEKQNPVRVIASIMDDEAPTHFGAVKLVGTNLQKELNGRSARFYGEDISPNVLRTRRLDNVFVPGEQTNHRFKIPNKIGLEAIAEVVRHMPGFVFGVRPYEVRGGSWESTLFVGLPSQLYRYSDKGVDPFVEFLSRDPNAKKIPNGLYIIRKTGSTEALDTAIQLLLKFANASLEGDPPTSMSREWASQYLSRYLDVALGVLSDRTRITDPTFDYIKSWRWLVNRLGYDIAKNCIRILLNDVQVISSVDYLGGEKAIFLTRLYKFVGLNLLRSVGALASGLSYGSAAVITEGGERFIRNFTALGLDPFEYNTDFDGDAFVSLPDWEGLLIRLLSPLDADEVHIKRFILKEDAAVVSSDGIPIKNWRDKCSRIGRFADALRNFVHYFAVFLGEFLRRNTSNEGLDSIRAAIERSKQSSAASAQIPDGYRPFRSYHWIDSKMNIMRNDIRATTETMANTVLVRYPNTEDITDTSEDGLVTQKSHLNWKMYELPYHSHIRDHDLKIRLVTEINASSDRRAEICALNNLATALSEMYRGEIVIQGNERIQPHDIVFIFDWHNMIFGPVEVESLTHVFLPDTGFATIINPAAVSVINGVDMRQAVAAWTFISNLVGEIRVSKPDNITTSLSWVNKTSKEVRSNPNKDADKNNTDNDRLAANVSIIPLTFNGRPWLAGLRGPDEDWIVFDKEKGRWEPWRVGQATVALARTYGGE